MKQAFGQGARTPLFCTILAGKNAGVREAPAWERYRPSATPPGRRVRLWRGTHWHLHAQGRDVPTCRAMLCCLFVAVCSVVLSVEGVSTLFRTHQPGAEPRPPLVSTLLVQHTSSCSSRPSYSLGSNLQCATKNFVAKFFCPHVHLRPHTTLSVSDGLVPEGPRQAGPSFGEHCLPSLHIA